jgi:hypothetical protein
MLGSTVVTPIVIAFAVFGALGPLAHRGTAVTEQTLLGTWGGEGIRVEGTTTGARIQVDCLLARTDEAIPLDESGKFAITMKFAPLQGAILEDAEDGPSSRVKGRVEKDVLHLTIGSEDPGLERTFTLQRNAKAKLPNCKLRS